MNPRSAEIGMRVRYTSAAPTFRTCVGTITKLHPRGATRKWRAQVKVDLPLPDWWPYPNNDVIAPYISELTPEGEA